MKRERTGMRSATLFAKLIDFLHKPGGSYADIAEHTGLDRNTVSRYVRALHDLQRVYIVDWHVNNRNDPCIPVWRLRLYPQQRDMPRPPKKTREYTLAYQREWAKQNRQRINARRKSKAALAALEQRC
jgi:hypothetical protein